jgi:hypothetical protein
MRIVFLHIPKTGGTSFKRMFGIKTIKHGIPECDVHVCYQHKNLVEVSAAIDMTNRFSIAFVRNPWERFVSWYLFHLRGSGQEISFEHFMREFLPENRLRGSYQHPYLFAEHCNVNWICRYERFAEECDRLAKILGQKFPLQHRNASRQPYAYRDFYTPSLRRHVRRRYETDLELLKYKF